MYWIFTCSTKGCKNNTDPVNVISPTNPVQCGICHAFADAIPPKTDKPTAKASKAKK